jgi:CBS domain containing-hemolysin-like protein
LSAFQGILLAVVLLFANALFVAAEFALISVRRTEIESLAPSSRAVRVTLRAMENVSLMLAGAQLGITICSLGLGAVGEPAVAQLIEKPFEAAGIPISLLHPFAFVVALGVVVLLHVVIGEMVPKNIALAGPGRSALLLTPVLVLVVLVLRPAIVVLNAVASGTLRLLRVELKNEVTSAFTRDEVAALVAESRREGLLDDSEHSLLAGALAFDQRDLSRVLISLGELVTAPWGVTPAQLEALAAATGFSRFPVAGPTARSVAEFVGPTSAPEGGLGVTGPAGGLGVTGPAGGLGVTGPAGGLGVTGPAGGLGVTGPAGRLGVTGELSGYLHVKDVIAIDERRRDEPVPVEVIRPLVELAVETTLRDGLIRLQGARVHLALVTANGSPIGVAMLEDLLEELVGEIRDQVHRRIPRKAL